MNELQRNVRVGSTAQSNHVSSLLKRKEHVKCELETPISTPKHIVVW